MSAAAAIQSVAQPPTASTRNTALTMIENVMFRRISLSVLWDRRIGTVAHRTVAT